MYTLLNRLNSLITHNPIVSTVTEFRLKSEGATAYPKLLTSSLLLAALLALSGCNGSGSNDAIEEESPTSDSTSLQKTDSTSQLDPAVFEGCYTVVQDEPAQIKVSLQGDSYVMQMPENTSTPTQWDTPEPLEMIELSQATRYFNIDPDNITGILGRPDDLFVFTHVKSAYVNINPLIDSPYLGFIKNASNTIYKVECE